MKKWRNGFFLLFLVAASLILITQQVGAQAESPQKTALISGTIFDSQKQPVAGAEIVWSPQPGGEPLAQTTSQPNGSFALVLPETVKGSLLTGSAIRSSNSSEAGLPLSQVLTSTLTLQISRPHFKPDAIQLDQAAVQSLKAGQPVALPEIVMQRRIDLGFWIATVVFILVLVLIASGQLHNTLASLLGAALLLGISYLGEPLRQDLFIFNFNNALNYVDWNVVFLIMGMMIVIAVVERTGIFQWLAYMAYRISGGRTWLLVPILMLITGVASAFLDNVTTMLLMTPITVQIALSMGISPLALLMPEVMASNMMGISTLIGTPTNILIGSYASITFNDFLKNLTPGVFLGFIGLVIYSEFVYRKELLSDSEEGVSALLLEKLAERARITEPIHLQKAGVVGLGMLLLFIFGENVHLLPSVTALMGATALLVWIKPDIEEMIEAVDWTTLVFFITLFIVVGAVQEVGLISFIAAGISRVVGSNLVLATLIIIWLSALLSTVIANIPFTAAMLPVVAFLSGTIPGATDKVLFYCLSVGSALGGNGSLIGASANMVTAGIAERAGYPITYVYFLKKGFPALVITVGLLTLWIFIRF
jgi:Na+/H+ antiporter NhaD/arsenite permease-like protein